MSELIFKNNTYQIIGICMRFIEHLGHGLSEIVYKDATEYEFNKHEIAYEREKEYVFPYRR